MVRIHPLARCRGDSDGPSSTSQPHEEGRQCATKTHPKKALLREAAGTEKAVSEPAMREKSWLASQRR